jgi:hypothetical protein
MTSLRTFQNEIDEIHSRENAKQRRALQERQRENLPVKEKESKAPSLTKGKVKEDGEIPRPDQNPNERIEEIGDAIQVWVKPSDEARPSSR